MRREQTDPIWGILRRRGQSLRWLADEAGYNQGFIRQVACGWRSATPAVRERLAQVMDLPESDLFRPRTSTRGLRSPRRKEVTINARNGEAGVASAGLVTAVRK